MNIRELQQCYENRIKDFKGFIYKQTRDDDDLRQGGPPRSVARSAKRPRRNRRLSDEQDQMENEGCLEKQHIRG